MATTRRKPSGVTSANTASSKSRASWPSMVTSGRPRRSTRRADSAESTWVPCPTASARASAEKSRGSESLAMAASVASVTGFSGSSRRSTLATPAPPPPWGYLTTRAITQLPWRAPFRCSGATAQYRFSRRSADCTLAARPRISTVARKAPTPRASTSMSCPDQRPSCPCVAPMRTWSPCMTPTISFGDRKMLSASSSLRTKPKPARLADTTPVNVRVGPPDARLPPRWPNCGARRACGGALPWLEERWGFLLRDRFRGGLCCRAARRRDAAQSSD